MPSSASCGWASGLVVQRRNRARCWFRAMVWPVKPLGAVAVRSRVGSVRMIFWVRAWRKNCRSTVSRRCPPGLGAFGDDHVRVGGALAVAVGEAAVQHLPAGRIQRHRVRALAEPDRPVAGVDVTDVQVADLAAGGAVQQGQDAQQRLVRVGIGAGGPAAEQGALLVQGDGLAGEAPGRGGGQVPGGVGQDDFLGAGVAEELPQHGQPSFARLGQRGQECLDVVHVRERPVLLAPPAGQEYREVAHDGQGGLDGVIGAGPGAGAAGPLPGGEHVLAEPGYCRAQRSRDGAEAALAPPGGEPFSLVGGQCQALGGEVVLQRAGQGAHRAARPAGAFEQVLRVVGVLVVEQAAKFGDHRAGAGRPVSGGQVGDEAVQPARRVGEPGGQVRGLHVGPFGAALPAR